MSHDVPGNTLEELLEQASRTRAVYYNRVNGETITFQIGRVVYSMTRQRADVFLRDALREYESTLSAEQFAADVSDEPRVGRRPATRSGATMEIPATDDLHTGLAHQTEIDAVEVETGFVARATAGDTAYTD